MENARKDNEQGNYRYQTSPTVCNHTVNSLYFLNPSPTDAKLTSLSYVESITPFTVSVDLRQYLLPPAETVDMQCLQSVK